MSRNDCRVYVGNLPPLISEKEIEDFFYRFGKIVYVDLNLKRRGPPFAFVDFENSRDARDVVSKCHRYYYDGYRLRVEVPRDHRYGGSGRGSHTRRSEYQVIVSGLPTSCSWQDLRDHMHKVTGRVYFADVCKDGYGIIKFRHYDDMIYAVKKLDHSKFRSHQDETSYIRVKEYGRVEDNDSSGRSRSRSHSPRRTRGSSSYSRRSSSSRSRSYERRLVNQSCKRRNV